MSDVPIPYDSDKISRRRRKTENHGIPVKKDPSVATRPASEIQRGQNFSQPEQLFADWEQINHQVQEAFIQKSKTFPGGSTSLKKEESYYNLVNQVIESHPQFRSAISQVDMPNLVELLRAYQFGYGALENYMRIEELEELYFNDYQTGFFKIRGAKKRIDAKIFKSEDDLIQFVKRVANENGLDFNLTKANVDATLRDGSRLSATLSPMAVGGPEFVIRKHPDKIIPIDEMIKSKTLTPELASDLQNWIISGLNIVISGSTSAGKTTLINTLINEYVPQEDRLIIIESNTELKAKTLDTKYYQTRADATREDPENDITLRELIRWSLRKDPDRIIIGELRGGEALDALVAWNSGHDGSLCTLHADTSFAAIDKLQMLCGMSKNAPTDKPLRSLISQAVDIVIQIVKNKQGQRYVSEVTQVLHRYKYDTRNQALNDFIEQAKENNLLQEKEGIMFMPLYEMRNQRLTKISNIIPVHGRGSI
jgi:pilus assembly protein CpaF